MDPVAFTIRNEHLTGELVTPCRVGQAHSNSIRIADYVEFKALWDTGGGSGASLPVVWASLQGNTDDYKDKTIHQAHIPTLPVSRIDGLATALAGKQPLIAADSKLDYSLLKNTPTIGNGTIYSSRLVIWCGKTVGNQTWKWRLRSKTGPTTGNWESWNKQSTNAVNSFAYPPGDFL